MPSSDGKRAARVAEQIREELMSIVLRGQIRDPQAAEVVVSGVRLTSDLRHARIYLRTLSIDPDERQRAAAVRAMERASGFLRREIGRRLTLKYTPDLRFFWDEGVDHALRIESLLSEIREDAGDPSLGEGDDGESDADAGDTGELDDEVER